MPSHVAGPLTTVTIAYVCSKQKKLLKSMKFPKEYEEKADLKKVNWDVMKPWIASRVTELLGVEDEVLIAYIYEQLEAKTVSLPANVISPKVLLFTAALGMVRVDPLQHLVQAQVGLSSRVCLPSPFETNTSLLRDYSWPSVRQRAGALHPFCQSLNAHMHRPSACPLSQRMPAEYPNRCSISLQLSAVRPI